MKTIDLHTHTTFSDGSYTPDELVSYAVEKGLAAIAITDHDTTEGIVPALSSTKDTDLEVIPGIEISSLYDKLEIHLVGLFIDPRNSLLTDKLNNLRRLRGERNIKMLERLNDLGIKITYNDLADLAGSDIITRAHFAKAMLKRGYISSINEAFERYIGDSCKAYIPRELPDYKTSIDMITKAGGIAVLAHPLLYKTSNRLLNDMTADLKKSGLTAIEAYYSTHSPSDTSLIKRIADENKLLLSGGSDFHGTNKKDLDLGTGYGKLAVPYEILDKLKGVIKNG